MFDHCDSLEDLNKHLPLKDKLICTHRSISEKFNFIARITITLYDPKTRLLKTYLDSSGEEKPLHHY